MTRAHPWVRISRVLLCLIIGFIAISVLDALRHDGFTVATDLSEMVPSAADSATHQLAVSAAQSAAEQSVILMLESSSIESLNQAVALVDKELVAMSTWIHRQNSAELNDQVVTDLAAYRFHLLTQNDSVVVRAGDFDTIVDRALTDLYSPSGGLRLLPLKQDPFNFFSRYVEAGIGRVGFTSGVDPLPEADDAREPMFREVITLRLLTSLSELREQATLNEFFNRLELALEVSSPDVRILRTGVLFFSNEAAIGAKRDINFISAGSITGISLLMLLVFRSIRPLVTAAISVLIGVGFAFTVVQLMYGSIHVFTIVFGASLIGIVIDYSIHYYYHSIAGLTDQKDNGRLHRALFVSLLTSIAGYSALLFSSVGMLQKIAVFSICGITAAWLTVLALAPKNAATSMKVRQHLVNPVVRIVGRAGGCVVDWPDRRFALFTLAAIFGGVVLLSRGQDDPRRFVDLSEDLLQQSAEIRTLLNDLEAGKFFIVEAENEQLLFDRLGELYAGVGDLARMVSVYDWLPSPSDQQLDYQAQAALYQESGPVNEFLVATGGAKDWLTSLQRDYLQSAEPLTSARFFDALKGRMSPMVLTTEDSAGLNKSWAAYVLLGTGSDIENVKMRARDIEGVSYIDTVAISTAQLRAQRTSSVWLLVLAYAGVGVLMWLLYRDRRAWVMTAVPAVSTVLTLAVLLLLGQPLTLFHTMSLFLILGLGMDYVVFLNEMTDDQKTTLQAIVLSGLTSMLSFGLLALSSVPVARAFGLTILIGNGINLLLTLGLARSTKWHPEAPR